MRTRDLTRLLDLLLKLHEETKDGQLRDEISHIRFYVHELLGEKEDW